MNTRKIALASACGAVVGYALGTTFLSGMWLWLAAFVGGIVGWIMFDPVEFVKAFSLAVLVTAESMNSRFRALLAEPWKKILPRSIRYAIEPLLACQMMGTVMLYVFICADTDDFLKNMVVAFMSIYGLTLGVGLLVSFSLFLDCVGDAESRSRVLNSDTFRKKFIFVSPVKFFAMTNLVVFPFTVVYLLIKGMVLSVKVLILLIRRTPVIVRFCWLVTVETCVMANHNGRLASFTGASIGALVGVTFGNIVVAMVTGAMVGVGVYYLGAFFPRQYVILLTEQLKEARAR